MTLTSAESDWNGFLKSVSLRMPHIDLQAAPAPVVTRAAAASEAAAARAAPIMFISSLSHAR